MIKKELVKEIQKNMYIVRQFRDIIERSIVKSRKLTTQQLLSISDLEVIGKSRLKDIAERTGSSTQTLCIMYNNLEKNNLVIREVDPNDRRNTYYRVSRKGLGVLKKHMNNVTEIVLKSFEKLSEEDIKELENSLRKVNDIMEKLF